MAHGVSGLKPAPQASPWWWLGGGVTVALLALAVFVGLPTAWQDLALSSASANPYRWFSAPLVHGTALHLGGNLVGLALLVALAVRGGLGAREWAAWLLLAWPLTQALLWTFTPALPPYGGLSGVLHAGVALVAVRLLHHAEHRAVGLALLLGLTLKVGIENPFGPLLRPGDWWGGASLPRAHATGLLAGLLVALLTTTWRK